MNQATRPRFPSRAVVTAGMPYGNKELHFGHVGGLFIHADIYARFLKDRIGAENVIFLSGTDSYGSAIELSYESLVASGAFQGSIQDFVRSNHDKQAALLSKYGIEPDLYAASSLGEAGKIHKELSWHIFEKLHDAGYLTLSTTKQFYDAQHECFLNGRQVTGRCPIQGCKSETAYADECALGHQYSPEELIAPVSALSGERPELRDARNWYFDLVRFRAEIEAAKERLRADEQTRAYLVSVIEEFLKPPSIYVKRDADVSSIDLPPFEVIDDAGKPSVEWVFQSLDQRAEAAVALAARGVRFRTGKTLVPFRLSGNVAWGIEVPARYGVDGQTFWCWPESLWAPISFTKACLMARGCAEDAYKDWWMRDDAKVYQFIGEDNIYFYSVAQTGLFAALPEEERPRLTTVVPNRHVLYMKRKAASSGAVKPPRAEDLLTVYSRAQLRLHFFHMNLGQNSIGFEPKALTDPDARGEYDPVLYEGNLLTNIYNRLIRSCFYTLQKHFGTSFPTAPVSKDAKEDADQVILAFEQAMYRFEFNRAFELIDQYLRRANKVWAERSGKADTPDAWASLLADAFCAVRTALTLLHPLDPDGTERVRDYLRIDDRIWDWAHIFEPLPFFFRDGAAHQLKFLEPRVDFFVKPDVQYQ